MKNTSEVYKSIDYLKQRFLLDRINVSWRDKESLKNIIDYVREFVFKDEVDNRYIINAMTWGFVQVLLLKLEDRELSSHLIREVLWKLEEVLNAPASRWKSELEAELICLGENGSSVKTKMKDVDLLIRDVIRYNTANNAIRG